MLKTPVFQYRNITVINHLQKIKIKNLKLKNIKLTVIRGDLSASGKGNYK
jgi:hypothetical protein